MTDDKTILTAPDKTQWNAFVDHLGGDYPTADGLKSFQKDNPKTTLTEDHIPVALSDVAAIKSNPNIQGLTPAYRANNTNLRYPVTAGGKHLEEINGDNPIPKPNYDDANSRLAYARQFRERYGDLMRGRGDTPLRINETPDAGSDTAKNMSIKAASKLGIDPKLLYASAMEEGMSGLFADKKGQVDYSGDEKHPISGYVSFGLDNFSDQFPSLVKKGYLPADFRNKFSKSVETNEKKEKVNSANFTDTDSALQAKAAMMKMSYDDTDAYAKKNGIKLSPKARDFFSLVNFNAGGGNMQKMLKEYNDNGYLKTDDFIDKRPSEGWAVPWENVSRRLQMADALGKEKLFN